MQDTKTPRGGTRALTSIERGRTVDAVPRQVTIGRRVVHRSLLGVLIATGFTGLVLLAAIVALHLRLTRGPIAISSLVPPIERAINRELTGVRVSVGGAILRYAKDGGGLQFRLREVRLLDDDGATVARAPFARVDLSGAALLRGQLAAERIDFIHPRLIVFYNQESGLALSFSRPIEAAATRSEAAVAASGRVSSSFDGASPTVSGTSERGLNLANAAAEALAAARRHQGASSFLKSFGMRDAVVILDQAGHQTYWTVPEFLVSAVHRQKRSIIEGSGRISSGSGPWGLKFWVEESEKRHSIRMKGEFSDLVPAALGRALPALSALTPIRVRMSGSASAELTNNGDIVNAEMGLKFGPGDIVFDPEGNGAVSIGGGDAEVRYDRESGVWQVASATIRGDRGGHLTVKGAFLREINGDGRVTWRFEMRGQDGVLGAGRDRGGGEEIRSLTLSGRLHPDLGRVQIEQFRVLLADGGIAFAGRISRDEGILLAGRLATMPTATFQRLWPPALAPVVRNWFAERVRGGRITDGTLSLKLPANFLQSLRDGGDVASEAVQVTLIGEDLDIDYSRGLPGVHADRAKATIVGRSFELTVPSGRVKLPSGRTISVAGARLRVRDLRGDTPLSSVRFETRSNLAAAVEYLSSDTFAMPRKVTDAIPGLSGDVRTSLQLRFPMASDIKARDLLVTGQANLEDAGAKNVFGDIDMQGGSVRVKLSQKAVEARGDVLLNGVSAKVRWLRISGAKSAQQPPLRITARLDENDRDQLGLEINHIVRGPVPVTLLVTPTPRGDMDLRVQADLGNAAVVLENLSWTKPPGRAASLGFRIKPGDAGTTQLQDFKLVGNLIAIDGWVSLGTDRRLAAFYFPEFSLDVITQLEIAGKLRKDDIWDIRVKGRTFDGRSFFRSLFSAEKLGQSALPPDKRRAGMDIGAEIETVVGFSDTSLHDLNLEAHRRAGRLVRFKANGRLDGDGAVDIRLETEADGTRYLVADSGDAGAAFRLVGFYQNVEGGKALLKVNLDQKGAAEKRGLLTTYNFVVLGDQVVTEVLADATDRGSKAVVVANTKKSKTRHTYRTRLQFDQMRIPFSVGHGQFVLHDSSINGPVLGATLRGKVDFDRKTVRLGGTYVPLYGLNSALSAFPVIGQILTGRQGEGLVGITFAIQGKLDKPQVIVNPISVVAPGIFRQIFEFNSASQKVRARKSVKRAVGRTPKSSSSPAIVAPKGDGQSGWTSDDNAAWKIENIR